MNTLAQHPVHYVFGMPTHAPLVIKSWMQEPFELKKRFFLWYISFFFFLGFCVGGIDAALNMVGIILLTTFMMTLPSAIADPSNGKLIPSISNAFFNAILSFHGFLMTYFILYNVVTIVAVALGVWDVHASAALLSLSAALLIGFMIQQVAATNKSVPWLCVPVISIAVGWLMLNFLQGHDVIPMF
jgi:hypothetical protein